MQQFPKAEEHFDTAIELEPQNPVHRVYKGSVSSRSSTLYLDHNYDSGGALASWLVRTTPDRVVWVRALAGVIVLCSEARHFTLTVLLFTQVYKWVPANVLRVTLRWTSIPSRGE